MDENDGPANGSSTGEDPVAKWWVECGNPLKNALRWIAVWRLEARDGNPREITYQEFDLRCTGHLVFDGEAYVMGEGVAEQVIARLGRPGLAHVMEATGTHADLELVSRLHYELACHIATTNKMAGRQLPEALVPFATEIASPVKRN